MASEPETPGPTPSDPLRHGPDGPGSPGGSPTPSPQSIRTARIANAASQFRAIFEALTPEERTKLATLIGLAQTQPTARSKVLEMRVAFFAAVFLAIFAFDVTFASSNWGLTGLGYAWASMFGILAILIGIDWWRTTRVKEAPESLRDLRG